MEAPAVPSDTTIVMKKTKPVRKARKDKIVPVFKIVHQPVLLVFK
jgi:hypothetical protein